MKKNKLLLIVTSAMLLTACGGEGNGSAPLSVKVLRPDGTPEVNARVQWCGDGKCSAFVTTNKNGIANIDSKFDVKEGVDYDVHIELPSDSEYAYNPNAYTQKKDESLTINLESYTAYSSGRGEAASPYVLQEGLYKVDATNTSKGTFYSLAVPQTGVYTVESWALNDGFTKPTLLDWGYTGKIKEEGVLVSSINEENLNFLFEINIYDASLKRYLEISANIPLTFPMKVTRVRDADPYVEEPEVTYGEVRVMNLLGRAMTNTTVNVYDNATNELLLTGKTNSAGRITIPTTTETRVEVTDLKPGFYQKEAKIIPAGTIQSTTVRILTQVIEKDAPKGTVYKLNDQIYDYSFTDSTGVKYSFAETLKTKKIIVINFWGKWCGWCLKEFPYMNQSYLKHKNDMEIFAFDDADNAQTINSYKQEAGIAFPMIEDKTYKNLFNIEGYPTTAIVNQYGYITFLDSGAILEVSAFDQLFEKSMDFSKYYVD